MTDAELLQLYMYVRLKALQGLADERIKGAIKKIARELMTAKSQIAEDFRRQAASLRDSRDAATGFFNERSEALASYLAGEIAQASAAEGIEAFEGAQAILSVDGRAKNVRLARGLTQEQFEQIARHQPLNTRSLAQWCERCFGKGVEAPGGILDALQEGAALGEGTAAITRRVFKALDEGMAIASNEAAMLARTYVQAANIGAQMAVYKRNEDVIKGYKWLAALDNRTCLNCAVGDGHVYGIHDKRPDLPLHPGCRCLYLPVTKSFRELGLDIDEFREAARPWTIREDGPIGKGGRKIEQVGQIQGRFKDWYFKLPPEDRARTSIGKTRGALLASGAIQWDEMIDFETGKIRTLASMGYSRDFVAGDSHVKGSVNAGKKALLSADEFTALSNKLLQIGAKYKTRLDVVSITSVSVCREDIYMSIDKYGGLSISDRTRRSLKNFNPLIDLNNALKNIKPGEALSFNQEYAIESLWHEITHRRQIDDGTLEMVDVGKRFIMEMLTQWWARRTYPSFMKELGGEAQHKDEIIEEGYGYDIRVKNFDTLLHKLGEDESDILVMIQDWMGKIPKAGYKDELIKWLRTKIKMEKDVELIINNLGQRYFSSCIARVRIRTK